MTSNNYTLVFSNASTLFEPISNEVTTTRYYDTSEASDHTEYGSWDYELEPTSEAESAPTPEAEPEPDIYYEPIPEDAVFEISPENDYTGIRMDNGTIATAEVEPEVGVDIHSEPEVTPESEIIPEPEVESESEPGVYVEPAPEWDIAKSEWGVAWDIHVCASAVLFSIIALYSLLCVLRLYKRVNLLSKGYFIALHSMLLILGLTRGVYFSIDPYNAHLIFHPILAYFLFTTAFPCLTAAFSIQLLALVQTLRFRPSAAKISNVRVLAAIITVHFLLSTATDVVVGALAEARIMVLICQIAFVIWGSFISGAYLYVFRRLYKAARRRQGMVRQLSKAHRTNSHSMPQRTYFEKPKLTMVVALKFTLMTSILTLLLAGLQVYAMCSVFNVLSGEIPDPWPWWAYQVSMRIVEIIMCFTMLYVASQPLRYNMQSQNRISAKQECLYLFPCHRICCSPMLEASFTSEEILYLENSPVSLHAFTTELPTKADFNRKQLDLLFSSPISNHSMRRRNTDSNMLQIITSTPVRKARSQPKVSMLINDSGFLRFREEGEIGGEPCYVSTDDDYESRAQSRRTSKKSWTPIPAWDLESPEKIRANGHILCNLDLNSVHNKTSSTCLSAPTSGLNTPVDIGEIKTPKSLCNSEIDGPPSDEFSFKAPSSIHLRDSIDRALNYDGFGLRTPDSLDISDTLSSIPNTPGSQGTSNAAFVFDPVSRCCESPPFAQDLDRSIIACCQDGRHQDRDDAVALSSCGVNKRDSATGSSIIPTSSQNGDKQDSSSGVSCRSRDYDVKGTQSHSELVENGLDCAQTEYMASFDDSTLEMFL